MSESKFTFCDICNEWQSINLRNGRGYAEMPRSEVKNVGWIRRNGQDICPQCQDEEYERQVSG